MEYKAIAYHDEWEDGRISGVLTVTGTTITFTAGDRIITFYKNEVILDNGGTGNRQVFIKSKNSDIVFSTGDKSILSHPFFDYHPRLQQEKRNAVSNFRKVKVAFIVGLGIFVLLVSILISNRGAIAQKLAEAVPYSIEQSLGKSYITQLALMGQIDSTSEATQMLRSKVAMITDNIDKSYAFKVYISTDTMVNAFALPGGMMVFNLGLLREADSWEEVLGVAAHEVAHVTEKHHSRGVFSRFGIWTLISMLIGDGSFLVDVITSVGANMEGLSYSREYETESDKKGFEYLQMANIDPKGLRTFFSKLEEEHKEAYTSSIPEFLSTHPSNENRIANIKEMEKAISKTDFVSFPDYGDFKKQLIHIGAESKDKEEETIQKTIQTDNTQ